MRKLLTVVFGGILIILNTQHVYAGEPLSARAKYFNIGFSNSKLSQENSPELSSDIGLSLTSGRSIFLHKPIAGKLRFGIDITWFDLSYYNYKVNYIYDWENWQQNGLSEFDYSSEYHQVECGVQIGASLTYSIVKRLQAQLYGRYQPCYSCVYYDEENFNGGFGNYAVVGLNISYGCIGLGIEGKFGSSKQEQLLEEEADNSDTENIINTNTGKIKTSNTTLTGYITFRF